MRTVLRLKITSPKFTPEAISAAVGLPATKSWRVGETHAGVIKEDNGWVLEVEASRKVGDEITFSELFALVGERSGIVAAMAVHGQLLVSCIIYCSSGEPVPTLYLARGQLLGIASLGADLDFDVYLA